MQLLEILFALFKTGKNGDKARGVLSGAKDLTLIVVASAFAGLGYMAEKHIESVDLNLREMSDSVNGIEKSVSELNTKMAVVVTKQTGHKEKIDDHEKRIRVLETKKR